MSPYLQAPLGALIGSAILLTISVLLGWIQVPLCGG